MAKAKSDKLTLKHIIGYGAGDCGGCFGLYMVSMFMARFLQVNLGVNAALLATINGIKLMVCGFPALAALGSFCCFTFVWCINADVRAKMAEWKAAKAQ